MNTRALIAVLFAFGCSKTTDTALTNSTNDLQQQLASQLQGYWFSDSYFSSVEQSKSIYNSKNYHTNFWGFKLEQENLLTDSAIINGFTEHEGGYWAPLRYDSTRQTFTHDLDRMGAYSFLKAPFRLKLVSDDRLEIVYADKKEVYRKLTDEQTELRKILFEGEFNDVLHNNDEIKFNADGSVTGMKDNTYFRLVNDFQEGIYYDAIELYANQESADPVSNASMFHFKYNGDTLKLYPIEQDWQGLEHTIGELEYLLYRKN